MRLTDVRAVILDIEGTLGSINYVKDVMFGYARARYGRWFAALTSDEQQAWRGQIDGDVVETLERWTDADVKHPVLKAVQARIWHAGFVSGDLRGDVYDDVEPALRRWRDAGIAAYIYSSGAQAAQRDWFAHSTQGDLTPLLDGYFDLDSAGSKKDADSYRLIAERIGVTPAEAVFFSDIIDELTAAEAAGMRAIHVVRDDAPHADRLTVRELSTAVLEGPEHD